MKNTTGNNFLYDAGNEQNTLTGMYDLFFRNYDPALGRMHQVDPLAAKYASHSTYKYGMNNPVGWNDPSGADDNQTDLTKAWQEMIWAEERRQAVANMKAVTDDAVNIWGGIGTFGDGGSAFARYGPGDGGALSGEMSEVCEGAREARERKEERKNYSSSGGRSTMQLIGEAIARAHTLKNGILNFDVLGGQIVAGSAVVFKFEAGDPLNSISTQLARTDWHYLLACNSCGISSPPSPEPCFFCYLPGGSRWSQTYMGRDFHNARQKVLELLPPFLKTKKGRDVTDRTKDFLLDEGEQILQYREMLKEGAGKAIKGTKTPTMPDVLFLWLFFPPSAEEMLDVTKQGG